MSKLDRQARMAALVGNDEPPPIPARVTGRALAELLGISERAVLLAVQNGRLSRTADLFDTRAALLEYCEGLRSRKAGGSLEAEKERLTRAQADRAEIAAARERGELVSADAVSREWAGILRDLRNALLAVPSRCGAGLPHLTSTDIATLERETRLALEGVAHGN